MKLDYKRTALLGFGFFGISVIWSIYNSYVPIFLKEYGISLAMVGLIMTFDNWIAIFIQPWIGFLSDRTRTRIGRRKPFLLIGAPIAAVFFCLLPILHLNLPQAIGALIAMMGAAIIMNIAMALFRTPTIALMPDITPSPLRSQANGIINFMGGLGTAIAFLGGAYLYNAGRGLPFFAAALLMLGAIAMVLVFIREPAEHEIEVEQVEEGTRQGVWPTIKEIVSDPDKSALFILLAILFWFIGYNALETFWTTYGKEFLGIGESRASAIADLFRVVIPGFRPTGRLHRRQDWPQTDDHDWADGSHAPLCGGVLHDESHLSIGDAGGRRHLVGTGERQFAGDGRRYRAPVEARLIYGVVLLFLYGGSHHLAAGGGKAD